MHAQQTRRKEYANVKWTSLAQMLFVCLLDVFCILILIKIWYFQSKENNEKSCCDDIRCMGHKSPPLATMDLRLALHWGKANCSRVQVLHSVHWDKSLHHFWHCYCCILHPCVDYAVSLLPNLYGDRKATERFITASSREKRIQSSL